MSYRDDREALHHRVAQLEEELAGARREGEQHGRDEAQTRAAELEKRLAEMRAEMERMGAELHVLRGDKPPASAAKNVTLIAALVSGVVILVGGATAVLLTRGAPVSRPEVIASPTPVTPPPPVPTVEPPTTVAPPRAAAPPTPPSSPRQTTARWSAKVTRSEGSQVAAGATCTVEATISTTDTNSHVPALTVQCGAQKLYDSAAHFNGMSQSSNDAREVLGPSDDKSTFTLAYRDIGTRTGERAQIDLDTAHRQASIFKETIPRFRVDLALPATSSPAEPLADAEHRLRRAGKVTHVVGAAPVKEGASCVLRAMPIGKQADCVAEIACGATVLWPATAPVRCTYQESRPVDVVTEEGATGLSREGLVQTVKGKAFTAEITLDEP